MSKYLAISKSQLVLPTMEKPEERISDGIKVIDKIPLERWRLHLSTLPRFSSTFELTEGKWYEEGLDIICGRLGSEGPIFIFPADACANKKAGWHICKFKCNECPKAAAVAQPGKEVEKPFELMKFPGEKGSDINSNDESDELEWLLRKAMDKGEMPANITTAFDKWLSTAGIKLNPEEKNVASIIFLAGMTHGQAADHLPSPGKQEGEYQAEWEFVKIIQENYNAAKSPAADESCFAGSTKKEAVIEVYEDLLEIIKGLPLKRTGSIEPYLKSIDALQPPAPQVSAEGKDDQSKIQAILEFNYNSFIGTRFTCEDWIPWEEVSQDQKDLVYACMGDYAASLPPHSQSYSREFVEGFSEFIDQDWYFYGNGVWRQHTGAETTTSDLLNTYIKSLNK